MPPLRMRGSPMKINNDEGSAAWTVAANGTALGGFWCFDWRQWRVR